MLFLYEALFISKNTEAAITVPSSPLVIHMSAFLPKVKRNITFARNIGAALDSLILENVDNEG